MTWAYFPALSLLATNPGDTTGIGVARGVLGARAPRRTEKKWGGGKFTGESCKCTPQAERAPPPPWAEQKCIFEDIGEIWTMGGLVVLACFLRATTKKGRQYMLLHY